MSERERFQAAVARRDAALVYGAASNAELLAAKQELDEARTALAQSEASRDERP